MIPEFPRLRFRKLFHHALVLQHGEYGTGNVALVADMPGVDAQHAPYLRVRQTPGGPPSRVKRTAALDLPSRIVLGDMDPLSLRMSGRFALAPAEDTDRAAKPGDKPQLPSRTAHNCPETSPHGVASRSRNLAATERPSKLADLNVPDPAGSRRRELDREQAEAGAPRHVGITQILNNLPICAFESPCAGPSQRHLSCRGHGLQLQIQLNSMRPLERCSKQDTLCTGTLCARRVNLQFFGRHLDATLAFGLDFGRGEHQASTNLT